MDIYPPNEREATFIKETFLNLKAPHAVIVVDFNTPLSSMNWSGKPKLYRGTVKLTEVLGKMDLNDIYRTFHTKSKGYTFVSGPHATFSKIYHKIGHKTHLNRYEKIEVI